MHSIDDYTNLIMWTFIELDFGIIAACLPSLRPIMKLALTGSVFTTNKSSKATKSSSDISQRLWRKKASYPGPSADTESLAKFEESKNVPSRPWGNIVSVTGPRGSDHQYEDLEMQSRGINVIHELEWRDSTG